MAELNLQELKKEFDTLSTDLTNPELIAQWEKFQKISKRRSLVEKTIKAIEQLEDVKNQIEENRQLLSSPEDDELSSMAEQELTTLVTRQQELKKDIEKIYALKYNLN